MPASGRTSRGRQRGFVRSAVWERSRAAPPLKEIKDQGGEAILTHEEVGATDSVGWVDAFLAANRDGLDRVAVQAGVRAARGRADIVLTSRDRLGAIPLRSPVTRRVAAGLLVAPRFGWSSVGRVLGDIGFRVEPDVGGLALVPGSAREVPPWVLGGPVIARIASAVDHLTRTFVPVVDERDTPRGTVDWNAYARRSLPTGRWTRFPCAYSDLNDDPALVSSLRWTLMRVGHDLEPASDVVVARRLLERVADLLRRLGPGPAGRPREVELPPAISSDWLRLALEAVAWVRDERGLGGARSLDGLPWSLAVSSLWEAWVESFLAALALRLGGRLTTAREGATRRPLVWRTPSRSLGHLAPDFLLDLRDRAVWVDAKYKDHLERLRAEDWDHLPERLRDSHRADIHQALAYAILADARRVDTLLAYPQRQGRGEPTFALAEMTAGDRSVRLGLASIPFGFEGPADREAVLQAWERHLRQPS